MQNIDLYYESLKQVYDQIESWPEHKSSFRERFVDWLVGISGVLFGLSLIPIFPAILIFVGSQAGLVISPIDLSVATFGQFILLWIVTTVVTGAIFGLMLWINSRVDSAAEEPKRPPQTLSPEQLTFVAVYESYKELKIFFVSHIEQHINNSLEALRRLVSPRILWRGSPSAPHINIIGERVEAESLAEEFPYGEMYLREYRPFRKPTSSFAAQVSVAQSFLNTFEKYAWFQLDTTTKSALQALISFPAKTYYRLLEKEDLPTVLSVLENLGKFVYAYLPEHQTYMGPEVLQKLQNGGRKALDSFVQQINDLAPYRSVVEKEKRPRPEISPPGFRKRLTKLYADNVFFRFAIWFIIILLLTSGIVYLVNQRVAHIDANVMVSIIIGASATGAATLAAFTPKASKEEVRQDQRNGSGED
ncbi:MAG: hypothetical protein NT096_12705 [Proteobacteria bacterium]|nr:hypothetical protein [Pseudomonadota bacterium]